MSADPEDTRDCSRFCGRDGAYWNEAARLVLEYLALHVGPDALPFCGEDFVNWLERSPDALRQYEGGDDMARASLVDQYVLERALFTPDVDAIPDVDRQ